MKRIIPGGCDPRREVYEDEPFEVLLRRLFVGRIKNDEDFCRRLWETLTITSWTHSAHGSVMYTFRSAGDVIAAIRESGDYHNWYCCGSAGVIDPEISEALAMAGWVGCVDNGEE